MAKNQRNKPLPPRTAAASRPEVVEATLNDVPRWLPATLYALVTIILFREFLFTHGGLLGTDTIGLSYFARSFYTNFVHTFHKFPLWDPLLYGGLPFVDGMHGDIFYPPSLALFFLDPQTMWGWKMLLHVFAAGIFCYLFLRQIGVSRGAAMFGGLIYLMGADLVSLVFPGGDGKLFVSALAPLAFLLIERAVVLHRPRDWAAFSLGLALMILTSHMQCAYFAIWGVTLYFFFRAIQLWRSEGGGIARFGVSFGAFALAGLLAVAATAIQIVPPLGYLREWSHRASRTEKADPATAYTYSTQYALHAEEIGSLVVPEFVGDDVRSGAAYWGKNGFKMNNEYAGLLGLLLLPLLFLRRRRGVTWFFCGLGVLSLLYALGSSTPIFHLFYLIPGVKLFRAPSIIIFLYGFSIAVLAALALDRAAEMGRSTTGEETPARRTLWIMVVLIGVLAVLATTGVFTNVWTAIFDRDISDQTETALTKNLPYIVVGFWITFAIGLVVASAFAGYVRGWWSARALLVVLCILAFADEYRIDWPFLHQTRVMDDNADQALFTPDESIEYLQQRQAAGEVFRAVDISSVIQQLQGRGYPENALAIHGIEQLAGHHGNEMGRYRELIGGPEPINIGKNISLLDLTNTEYIVSPALVDLPSFKEVFRGSRSVVMQKADVLPRAYLVGAVEVVPDENAVDRMLSTNFDYRRTAIVATPLNAQLQPDPKGSVQWLERTANAQRLSVQTDRPALLVVLDNYYKSWHAHVDGKDAPIIRANYAFRAVVLPAGKHEVTFTYLASSLHMPAMISAITLLVLMFVAFWPPKSRAETREAA